MRNLRPWILLLTLATAVWSFSQSGDVVKAKSTSQSQGAKPATAASDASKSGTSGAQTASTPEAKSAGTDAQAKPETRTEEKPAEKSADQTPLAEHQFKNITSLKGTPADQLVPAMQYFSASLGVGCGFCHVTRPTWAPDSDDKGEKRTAREMIAMTQSINQANFKGRPTIGCATCHGGHANPNPVPGIPLASGAPGGPTPGGSNQGAGAARQQTPSADQVLASYYDALGGKAALEKLTGKTTRGIADTPQGKLQFEIDQKAPNLYAISLSVPTTPPTLASAYAEGFNGSAGWRNTEHGSGDLEGPQLALARLSGVLFDPALLPAPRSITNRVRVESINGHDCYVLNENTSEPGLFERLYFDQKTRLLVRRVLLQRTLFGPLPITWDYDDYRDVHGVKVPFTVIHTDWINTVTFKADSVDLNPALDDKKFSGPAE
jgi:hypothetical protein